MGKPSDKRRSARRPGKRERARAKKHRKGRIMSSGGHLPPAGHDSGYLGRKKLTRWHTWSNRVCNGELPSSSGEPIRKASSGTLGGGSESRGHLTVVGDRQT